MRRRRVYSAFAFVLVAAMVSCAEDPTTSASSSLDQVAPTKADIAKAAGFSFPDSVESFRVVRLSGSNLNVSFRIDPDQVAEFTSRSNLDLQAGSRVIVHASPVWDLNPDGDISGVSDDRNGIHRDVEVVSGTGKSTVRISLINS